MKVIIVQKMTVFLNRHLFPSSALSAAAAAAAAAPAKFVSTQLRIFRPSSLPPILRILSILLPLLTTNSWFVRAETTRFVRADLKCPNGQAPKEANGQLVLCADFQTQGCCDLIDEVAIIAQLNAYVPSRTAAPLCWEATRSSLCGSNCSRFADHFDWSSGTAVCGDTCTSWFSTCARENINSTTITELASCSAASTQYCFANDVIPPSAVILVDDDPTGTLDALPFGLLGAILIMVGSVICLCSCLVICFRAQAREMADQEDKERAIRGAMLAAGGPRSRRTTSRLSKAANMPPSRTASASAATAAGGGGSAHHHAAGHGILTLLPFWEGGVLKTPSRELSRFLGFSALLPLVVLMILVISPIVFDYVEVNDWYGRIEKFPDEMMIACSVMLGVHALGCYAARLLALGKVQQIKWLYLFCILQSVQVAGLGWAAYIAFDKSFGWAHGLTRSKGGEPPSGGHGSVFTFFLTSLLIFPVGVGLWKAFHVVSVAHHHHPDQKNLRIAALHDKHDAEAKTEAGEDPSRPGSKVGFSLGPAAAAAAAAAADVENSASSAQFGRAQTSFLAVPGSAEDSNRPQPHRSQSFAGHPSQFAPPALDRPGSGVFQRSPSPRRPPLSPNASPASPQIRSSHQDPHWRRAHVAHIALSGFQSVAPRSVPGSPRWTRAVAGSTDGIPGSPRGEFGSRGSMRSPSQPGSQQNSPWGPSSRHRMSQAAASASSFAAPPPSPRCWQPHEENGRMGGDDYYHGKTGSQVWS